MGRGRYIADQVVRIVTGLFSLKEFKIPTLS